MTALVALTGLLIGAADGPLAPPDEALLAERVAVPLPSDAGHDVTELGGDATLLKVTLGEAALIVTVYAGKDAPGAWKALGAHTEELERAVAAGKGAKKTRQTLLGQARAAREVAFEVEGVAHTARVVAARKGGVTVVCVWTVPDKGGNAASAGEALEASVRGVAVR